MLPLERVIVECSPTEYGVLQEWCHFETGCRSGMEWCESFPLESCGLFLLSWFPLDAGMSGVLTGVFVASSCRYGGGLESSPGMSRYGGGLVLDET